MYAQEETPQKITFCSSTSHWGFVKNFPYAEAHFDLKRGQVLIKKPVWALAGV